jgi:protein-ribulosamine 3-kinase
MSFVELSEGIARRSGIQLDARSATPVSGGDISITFKILDVQGTEYFLKLNHVDRLSMFEAEQDGLLQILESATVRAPEPICVGSAAGQAYILMEWLDLAHRSGHAAAELGEQLAAMHRKTSDHYGWQRDNSIGLTPQPNNLATDWIGFYRDHRLGYQIELARDAGHHQLYKKGARLLEVFAALFVDYVPVPSLLHGDLWDGNWGVTAGGEPVIFDPALYYGDREADLAMTHLFGEFPPEFYTAYAEAWPLDPGYKARQDLYNLYHVLNHLHLFGDGYLSQAEQITERLLAKI